MSSSVGVRVGVRARVFGSSGARPSRRVSPPEGHGGETEASLRVVFPASVSFKRVSQNNTLPSSYATRRLRPSKTHHASEARVRRVCFFDSSLFPFRPVGVSSALGTNACSARSAPFAASHTRTPASRHATATTPSREHATETAGRAVPSAAARGGNTAEGVSAVSLFLKSLARSEGKASSSSPSSEEEHEEEHEEVVPDPASASSASARSARRVAARWPSARPPPRGRAASLDTPAPSQRFGSLAVPPAPSPRVSNEHLPRRQSYRSRGSDARVPATSSPRETMRRAASYASVTALNRSGSPPLSGCVIRASRLNARVRSSRLAPGDTPRVANGSEPESMPPNRARCPRARREPPRVRTPRALPAVRGAPHILPTNSLPRRFAFPR